MLPEDSITYWMFKNCAIWRNQLCFSQSESRCAHRSSFVQAVISRERTTSSQSSASLWDVFIRTGVPKTLGIWFRYSTTVFLHIWTKYTATLVYLKICFIVRDLRRKTNFNLAKIRKLRVITILCNWVAFTTTSRKFYEVLIFIY